MSFDVNIGRTEPVIKAAAGMNNDGGSSGNTGYMSGGGGGQKREENGSLFDNNKNKTDSFELSTGVKLNKNKENEEKSGFKKLFRKLKIISNRIVRGN